jgi:hypothetical protein
MNMAWSVVKFGKYAGMTLPQILLLDPDWFFWALPKLYGQLGKEAKDLDRKARAIKIPGPNRMMRLVEYEYDDNQRFIGFWFVKPEQPPNSRFYIRSRYLDFSRARRGRAYDKSGCRTLIRDFRRYYFGADKRLTKERCEAFFDDEDNFARPRQDRIGVCPSDIRETARNQPMPRTISD